MKILQLLGWYYPESVGGTETYVSTLARDLIGFGHDVTIAAPHLEHKPREYEHDGVKVFRYPVAAAPSKAELRGDIAPEYLTVFADWIREQSFDLVHQHSYTRGCGYFHATTTKQLGLPLVFTAHVPGVVCPRGTLMRFGTTQCDGTFGARRCTSCVLQFKGLPRPVSSILATLSPSVGNIPNVNLPLLSALLMKSILAQSHDRLHATLEAADIIVSVASWLREMLILNGTPSGKIVVSRHGILSETKRETAILQRGKQAELVRVGYIGRLHPTKGVHILLQAIKRLGMSVPIKVIIGGRANSDEEQAYDAWLRQLAEGSANIEFVGEITAEGRSQFWDRIDILAVPSIGFETGPLVVLEAFAQNIPVIGSNFGGISELVRDNINGLLINPTVIELADRLLYLAENPNEISRLQLGIPKVKESSMVASEMQEIYKNIFQSKLLKDRAC